MGANNHKLIFYNSNKIVKKISVKEDFDGVITVGRDNSSHVVLDNKEVSKIHAQIIIDKGELQLVDLESTNGTFFRNKKINSNIQVKLSDGDEIFFSTSKSSYLKIVGQASSRTSEQHKALETDLQSLIRKKDRVSIGRNEECDLVIYHPQISRKHCEIIKDVNGVLILKDYSRNGTFVNGKKIQNSHKLSLSDKIIIGPYVIPFKGDVQDLTKEVAIRAEGVEKVYKNGFKALNDCYLNINSRTLMAIMGPSGCGKSTLLKTLNGESPATRGKVYLFNQELTTNYEYLKTQIGYVPQDDIVHKELTVYQSMYYAAKLRLENRTEEDINLKIHQILDSLNISFVKDQLVGQISGGQRKRVSIAVELLTDPLILFLDEPTSPLDPQTIDEFLKILKNLANNGTTVVMVTHKPEDLAYMDSTMFLSEGGHIVYDGPSSSYKEYFGVSSAVEVYAALVGNKAKKWIHKFNDQNNIKKRSFTQNKKQAKITTANAWNQFYWLSARHLKIKTNDRLNSAILILQAPIIAILLLLIFDHITQAVPFLIAISAIWFGANNSAREIVGELPIYSRERMFNLKIIPYIFSKLSILTIIAFIQAILFILIISLRYDDPEWNNILGSILWMVTISVAATLMGLLLSSTSNTTEKVMSIVPISLIPQIMLAGVITRITNEFVEVLSYLTLSRWGTEGFSILQERVYTENLLLRTPSDKTTNAIDQLKLNFNDLYEDLFGDLAGTLELDIYAITALSGVFFFIVYKALKNKDAIYS